MPRKDVGKIISYTKRAGDDPALFCELLPLKNYKTHIRHKKGVV